MSSGNWRSPPIFEANLRLSKVVLELQKKDLETKLTRIARLLQSQLEKVTNGKLGDAKNKQHIP